MRTAFVKSLVDVADKDRRIFLLSGDLGYGALEPFSQKFPKQFLNLGIAEQNLAGFAAGMALSGKIPVIYSIATFVTLRPYEQIRNDICYQNLNVKIIGTGGGLTYSQYGATHQSMEDIGLMRLLPNMVVLCPGDPIEVNGAVKAMMAHDGPCYLRIGSRGEPNIHKKEFKFKIGKGIVIQEGKGTALIATGNILENAVKAGEILKEKGIMAEIVSMPTIKPIDQDLILKIAGEFKNLFTVEEHSLIGGLGSTVCEVLSENKVSPNFKFHRIAGPDAFQKTGGGLSYMRDVNGLSPEKIAETVLKYYSK